ncbi:class C beta-lactamase [Herbaspirillum robiniae]|uniref:Beta-lactamase n=1 Tax=Herbaspirillum robiniae TaxID=2014887 RepID=A0ABX2LVF8_9BURK|nr:class C beta-lactamase [Herbaspirillum robiniae]NUU01165.1 beta-lactamase [Herbaspirillum robiniae]
MKLLAAALATALFSLQAAGAARAADLSPAPVQVRQAADRAAAQLMDKYKIPGMALGIVSGGRSYAFQYGAASLEPRKPVTADTLFELGSISKTFTATLTAYAELEGHLSLQDKVSQHLPALKGSAFGEVPLLHLGTHTPGGLPLQLPDDIHDEAQLIRYLQHWKPSCATGACRTYANPGIGTLGLITARSMGGDFTQLMQERLLPALGLHHTYLRVPQQNMPDYAMGYDKNGNPIRLKGGLLAPEAYGVRSTVGDMLAFMRANLEPETLPGKIGRAVAATHTGYFQAATFTQDLIWEQYPYPTPLQALLEGNSPRVIAQAVPATAIVPPTAPRADVWINKTGSTNGFGAYIAYIPSRKIGVVMLANRNFPNDARVGAAYDIIKALDDAP